MASGARLASGVMPMVEHLRELRLRLIYSALAVLVAGVAGFVIYDDLLRFLLNPYCDLQGSRCRLLVTDPLEGITVRLRIAAYFGFVGAFPVIAWQMWKFAAPAMTKTERRYALPFVLSSSLLFLAGGALAFVTLPAALGFLSDIGGPALSHFYSPGPYLRLILFMILAFGITFEFPVVLVFLQLTGLVRSSQLRRRRRVAVVLIFAAAAVITPSQDPYSLMAMALPLLAFYEGAIVIGRMLGK